MRISADVNLTAIFDGDATTATQREGTLGQAVTLDADLNMGTGLNGDATVAERLDGEYGSYHRVITGEEYTGQTDITPTRERQVLSTQGKAVNTNIIIEPIPQNYGLITWDGTRLMVS